LDNESRKESGSTANPLEVTPPSLDLAFEWLKGVLLTQKQESATLDSKIASVFTAGTVVLGLGISAGIISLTKVTLAVTFFGVLALVAYFTASMFAFFAWKTRTYEMLDDPAHILEWQDKNPSEFKRNLLSGLKSAYVKNQRMLTRKASQVDCLIGAALIEIYFVVLCVSSIAFSKE
jgi:hypothetical protein